MIKRVLAVIICVCFALSLAACGCNSSNGQGGKTIISQVDDSSASNAKPAKAISSGRISGDAAPTGWTAKTDEGVDCITYAKGDDGKAYIKLSCDSMPAEDLFKSVVTLKDTKGEGYSTDSVTIGDNLYFAIYPNEGENSLFGTVGSNTLVINYLGVDVNDQTVQKIIGGIEIAPEK